MLEAMPERFRAIALQPQDLSIWDFDPVKGMLLLIILVPIAFTMLVLAWDALARRQRGSAFPPSSVRLTENRFKLSQQATARLERRRFTAPHLKVNAVRRFRRHPRSARMTSERRLRRSIGPISTNENFMSGRMIALKAYKRSPAIDNSSWYKGMLLSRLAGPADNDGAFDLVVSMMRHGIEPPPHVHSREDELFYVLSGELRVYVGSEVLTLSVGECIFLPRGIPHALIVASEEARLIALITPGGYAEAFNTRNARPQRMEVRTDPDEVPHAKADLGETIRVFNEYGVRMLTPDEILTGMPRYPR